MNDTKTIALQMLKGAFRLFAIDLEHLADTAFTQSFGPRCRTVADIVYEVNLVNDHVGITIRREQLFPWPDGWVTAPADFCTKEIVVEAFKQSSERFLATIEAFTEEDMTAPVTSDGKETNPYERCRFVAVHTWYHSGQLNFIQTLLGDDEMHW